MGWYQRRVHGECCSNLTALNMNQIILFLAFFGCTVLSEEVVRKPKLFFVSTSATTSTLQTLSICYVSSATPAACTGRKRRSISLEPAESKSLDGMEASHAIQPSTINREVDGGQDREGRFLLYWITTTSISTSTSFTTTYTVSSVSCTPAGGNLCG